MVHQTDIAIRAAELSSAIPGMRNRSGLPELPWLSPRVGSNGLPSNVPWQQGKAAALLGVALAERYQCPGGIPVSRHKSVNHHSANNRKARAAGVRSQSKSEQQVKGAD